MSIEDAEKEMENILEELAAHVNSEEYKKNKAAFDNELSLIKKSGIKISFASFLKHVKNEFGDEFTCVNFNHIKDSFAYYVSCLNNHMGNDLNKLVNFTANDWFSEELIIKSSRNLDLRIKDKYKSLADLVNSYHSYLLQHV